MKWDVELDCSPSCQLYRDTAFLSNHRNTENFTETLTENLRNIQNQLSIEPDVDKAFQIVHDTFDSTLLEFAPLKSAKNKTKVIPACVDNKLKIYLRSEQNKSLEI